MVKIVVVIVNIPVAVAVSVVEVMVSPSIIRAKLAIHRASSGFS